MNALTIRPRWRLRLRRRAKGFVLYEAVRRPGIPAPTANAQARFEYAARHALREWLMV